MFLPFPLWFDCIKVDQIRHHILYSAFKVALVVEVGMVSPMSLQRCVSVSVVECLYNQIDKVDRVSPRTIKR